MVGYDKELSESAPRQAMRDLIDWLREKETDRVTANFDDCSLVIVLKENGNGKL